MHTAWTYLVDSDIIRMGTKGSINPLILSIEFTTSLYLQAKLNFLCTLKMMSCVLGSEHRAGQKWYHYISAGDCKLQWLIQTLVCDKLEYETNLGLKLSNFK